MKTFTSIAATVAFTAAFFLLPARFCEGIRFDDQLYGPFIQANALAKYDAEAMRDPVIREAVRRAKAEKWSGQVRAGQISQCGKASF